MEFLFLGAAIAAVALLLKSRASGQRAEVLTGQQQIEARRAAIHEGQIATFFAATSGVPGANVLASLALPQFGPLGEGCSVGPNCQFVVFADLFAYNKSKDPKYINPFYASLTAEQSEYIRSLGYYDLTPQQKADVIFKDTGIRVAV